MPNVLFVAGFFACGIAISSSGAFPSLAGLVPAIVLAIVLSVILYNVSFPGASAAPMIRSVVMMLCVCLLGGYRSSLLRSRLNLDHARLVEDPAKSVHATVSNYRSAGSFYTRLGVTVDSLCVGQNGGLCHAASGGSAILVFNDSILAGRLFPGVRILADGKLTSLPEPRNPGGFDYGAYLKRQGFAAELKIADPNSIEVDAESLRRPSIVVRAQRAIRTHIDNHIPDDHARAMLVALTLGDRSGIDESVQQNFRNTGLMHLLAVSGLHVLVVGYSVYRLLGGFLLRIGVGWLTAERIRSIVTLAVLLFYYFVAGQSVSIFRALIMASIFLLQHVLKRRALLLNSLGVAGIIVLFANPADLFSVGFQLSFGAVASLSLLNPLPERFIPPIVWIRRVPRRMRVGITSMIRSIASSFAATIGTLPILVYHFGFVSFAGIVLNLLAIPVTAAALSSGILSVLAATLGMPGPADWLGTSSAFFTLLLVQLTTTGNHIFEAVGFTLSPPGTLLSGIMLSGLLFYAARRNKWIRWKVVVGSGAMTVFLFFSQILHQSPTLDIVFMDVGQGDAVLVVSPEGKTMLIDSGPPPYREGATSETVAAVLDEWHLATIDFLVHSHPHADHIGGSADVLQHIPVGRIVENGIARQSESFESYDSLAVVKGIDRAMAMPGSLIHLSTTTTVEILAPDHTLLDSSNLNDSSVVLRIVFGETCALLTGDIEFAAEVRLVSRYRSDLHCAVVKIPHHGSNTSSTPGFVGRTASPTSSTQATFAVVSVARVNRFGLPDQEALNRWSNSGAIVRSTQNGAVWLKSDGKTFREYDWRTGR